MLSNLGVRQKLNLLLLLPLLALVCTVVPFTVERVDDARAAEVTAGAARLTRNVGGLVQEVQQERVVALAYLVLGSTDRSVLLTQQWVVDDSMTRVRADVGRSAGAEQGTDGADGSEADLVRALDRVGELGELRRLVLSRSIDPVTVYEAYQDAVQSLLDALHLTNRIGADAVGQRQLATLDALMRADQAASDIAAGLVIAAVDRDAGALLLASAAAAEQLHRDRFRQVASSQQSSLLDFVERGASGLSITAALQGGADTAGSAADVATTLSVASTYDLLRQVVKDQVTTDIANAADRRETDADLVALGVGSGAFVMLVLLIGLSVYVSRSIALPLHRLARTAATVADIASAELVRVNDADEAGSQPPRLAAVNLRDQHEIGELAAAINRVLATAALLLERQVSTQRNVAVMFANISRRTQSLVTRQLSLIDDMERNEQDALVLEKLYRLDHLTTRLRRSADSLLVVSGNRDKELVTPTQLVTVIRAAAGEIEGFQAVRLGEVCDITIGAELVADLRLLLAELLENATAFSPPGAFVEVGAEFGAECRITVVDFGIGMPPARMQEENRRILERPRLDVAPTEVLGLFVVGRLARRHGLTVRLDPTAGQGVTATVLIPSRLYSVSRQLPAPAHPAAVSTAAWPATATWQIQAGDSFPWFAGSEEAQRKEYAHPATAAASAPAVLARTAAPQPAEVNSMPPAQSRNGLNRRTPGSFASSFQTQPARPSPTGFRNAEAEAAQLTAFAQGVERATAGGRHAAPPTPPRMDRHQPAHGAPAVTPESHPTAPRSVKADRAAEPGTGRHGLSRRTPGAHLHASARTNPPVGTPRGTPATVSPTASYRDPESERNALNGFVEGLARAAQSLNEFDPHDWKKQR
ncbi:nitrate- and nitrite sensing domain-containing protein [Dactylosporangium sp. NPDC050688]|uniref:sensor histidine kinase n=1 Tax=Dactylosporangium sp. NPDC050688 TaxID=3157217 RepID=UPI0033FFC518